MEKPEDSTIAIWEGMRRAGVHIEHLKDQVSKQIEALSKYPDSLEGKIEALAKYREYLANLDS